MTPLDRVRRARVVLAGTVVLAAALWAAAAAMAALALAGAAAAVGLLPAGAGAFVLPAAVAAALGAVAAVLWRERSVWSLELVALWLEEHAPQLKYALVTMVDPRHAEPELVAAASRVDMERIVRRSAGRSLSWAAGAFALSAIVVVLLWSYAPGAEATNPLRAAPPAEMANRLTKLRAEVVPPSYSNLPRRVVNDPTNVAGLVGSRVHFLGDGAPEGVTAVLDRDTIAKDTIHAAPEAGGWGVAVSLPKLPGLIRFEDRTYHSLVALEPQADSVPRLLLRLPARDTTYRLPPSGELVLQADVDDDYGLQSGRFEILVSTGSAESFQTDSVFTRRVEFGGKRGGALRATMSFASLKVAPGTVLHIRATALDRNDVTGPGKGFSETRTLRVATPQEYDTTYVAAAPPLPIDTLFVSQRLLNLRTDTLIRLRQPTLERGQYVDTSIQYSNKQEQIRQRVEKVIAIVEDDGVGGKIETDLSRLLRAAADSMWTARTYLAIGMPDSALTPHMKEALRLLDLARAAAKYHIRGVLRSRPVNIELARLKGTDSANAAVRTARPIPEDLRLALRKRLGAVAGLVAAEAGGLVDSLIHIRIAALRGAPAVVVALQEAIDALRGNASPAAPLARAQRLLDPPLRATTGPVEWGGVLP